MAVSRKLVHERKVLLAGIDLEKALEEIAAKHKIGALDVIQLLSHTTNRAVQRMKTVTFQKRKG